MTEHYFNILSNARGFDNSQEKHRTKPGIPRVLLKLKFCYVFINHLYLFNEISIIYLIYMWEHLLFSL